MGAQGVSTEGLLHGRCPCVARASGRIVKSLQQFRRALKSYIPREYVWWFSAGFYIVDIAVDEGIHKRQGDLRSIACSAWLARWKSGILESTSNVNIPRATRISVYPGSHIPWTSIYRNYRNTWLHGDDKASINGYVTSLQSYVQILGEPRPGSSRRQIKSLNDTYLINFIEGFKISDYLP